MFSPSEFQATVLDVGSVWLRSLANIIITAINTHKQPKGTRISGVTQGLDAKISATGKWAELLAFDFRIFVPAGGFTPPTGKKAWSMEKPHGKPVIRTRIYNRLGGKIIRRDGYMTQGFKDVWGPPPTDALGPLHTDTISRCYLVGYVGEVNAKGREKLNVLGRRMSVELSDIVAHNAATIYRKQGMNVKINPPLVIP